MEEPLVSAGIACAPLIADPASWINRRVETIELLSREETRWRVSIDWTLTKDQLASLEIGDGVVVPIAALSKEPRRNFDLTDESGRAVPVLGRRESGELSHIALMEAALNALPEDTPDPVLDALVAELGQVVVYDPADAAEVLGGLVDKAESGDVYHGALWSDVACRVLLTTLWRNYVLFAVLPIGGSSRRILKYGYGDDLDLSRPRRRLGSYADPRMMMERIWRPDRRRFIIECPVAWRSASFHVEVAVPEELRVEGAQLFDFVSGDPLSAVDAGVNRAALSATEEITPAHDVRAYVQVVPERSGRTFQAAATSSVIAALLWLGVVSGLDASNPAPAVAILLTGVALFSGFTASRAEHPLAKRAFAAPRRWLLVSTFAALAGSATLAMEVPSARPVTAWFIAALVATAAAIRLVWSACRCPG